MNKKAFYFLLILILSCGCSHLVGKKPLNSFIQNYQSSKYQKATVEFLFFIQNNPDSSQKEKAYFYLGKCYFGMKNYYMAGKTFQEYLQIWPDGEWADKVYEDLKLINNKFNKVSYAKEDVEKEYQKLALAYKEVLGEEIPKDALYLQLGNIYWEQGENEKAKKGYMEAIKLNPSLKRKTWLMKRMQKLRLPEINAKPDLRILNKHIRDSEKLVQGIITSDNSSQYTEKRIKISVGKEVVISGEVENNGEVSVSNLRIHIISYDFYRRVLNASYAYLDRLEPGETMPFSITVKGISQKEIGKVDYQFIY